MRSPTKWFRGLSKVGQVGASVGLATLGVAIVAGASSNGNQTSQPASQPVVAKTACASTVTSETEKKPIPFTKSQVYDPTMTERTTKVTATGVNGEKVLTYKVVTYTPKDCDTDKRTVEKEEISIAAIAEVTSIGTKKAAPITSNCHPSYSPCVPNATYDLDCADIGFTVTVTGSDPYRLDRDNDGYGCE